MTPAVDRYSRRVASTGIIISIEGRALIEHTEQFFPIPRLRSAVAIVHRQRSGSIPFFQSSTLPSFQFFPVLHSTFKRANASKFKRLYVPTFPSSHLQSPTFQLSTATICSSEKLIQITNRNKSSYPQIWTNLANRPHIYGLQAGNRNFESL